MGWIIRRSKILVFSKSILVNLGLVGVSPLFLVFSATQIPRREIGIGLLQFQALESPIDQQGNHQREKL